MRRALIQDGAIRERVVFAWWPIACDDGTEVWLERVNVREEYRYQGDPFNGSWWAWTRIAAWPNASRADLTERERQ